MIKNQKLLNNIAQGRIRSLVSLAKARTLKLGGSDALSKRYVKMAREIISHYKIPAGREMKSEVCDACSSVLIPGVNCSVRLVSPYGYVAYRCVCGEEKHVMYRHGPEKGFKDPSDARRTGR